MKVAPPRRPIVSPTGAGGLTRARRTRLLRGSGGVPGEREGAETRGAGEQGRPTRGGAIEEEESPAEQRYS
jgi:hypothetical protein